MDKPANILAAERFVELVTKCDNPSIQVLSRHLDELALNYHDTPDGNPADSNEQPGPGYRVSHADIGRRFPGLGFYGTTDPTAVPGEPLVGDAIDDIMDIANDLKEVLWRYQRFGPDDADWHFRFLYRVHWGEHLRDLARYLHAHLLAEAKRNSA